MNPSDSKITLVVEDNGLKYFLDKALSLAPFKKYFFDIIPGGGWTKVYSKYKELLTKGYDPIDLIPVIDADTLEEKKPRDGQIILENPNLFRLYKDLEFVFENWMLAEALIKLSCSPFDSEPTPQNFQKCERIVNEARQTSIKDKVGMHVALEQHCKKQYSLDRKDPSTFVLPSKMDFARALTEVVINSGSLPREIYKLLIHIQDIAEKKGITSIPEEKISYPNVNVKAIQDAGLSGKVLFSVYPHLWILDLTRQQLYASIGFDYSIGYSIWSRDGLQITGEARQKDQRSILIIDENGTNPKWVSRKISVGAEGVPCWFPDGNNLLLRTEQGTYKASPDSKKWKQLYDYPTAYHCISKNGMIAKTVYDHQKSIYFLQINSENEKQPNEIVPGTTDVRGSISWSPSGRFLAFANQITSERGAVCLYDYREKKTSVITSHDGWPYFVCFSPDEKFVIYTCSYQSNSFRSLRIVDIFSKNIFTLFESAPDITIGCHAWKG